MLKQKPSKMKSLFVKKKKKDCLLQDRFIYEINTEINDKFSEFLEQYGELTVFRSFEVPMIAMDIKDRFRMTALYKTNKIDIFFKEKCPKTFIRTFEKKLNKFIENNTKEINH